MTRRISIARSTSPSASARAALQSIIAAPVRSRSAFTSAAVTLIWSLPLAVGWRGRRRPELAPARLRARRRFSRLGGGRGCRWARCRVRLARRARSPGGGAAPAAALGRAVASAASLAASSASTRAFSSSSRFLRSSSSFLRRSISSAMPLLLLDAPGAGAGLDRAADRADHQLAGADRVVVAGDHVVDRRRVAVGVDQADDRDPQAGRLAHRDLLGFEVGDEDGVGQAVHVADAAEVVLELRQLGLHAHPLLGRQQLEFALLLPARSARAGGRSAAEIVLKLVSSPPSQRWLT